MDLDAYVAAHRADWQRLETLLARASRPRRLSGGEVDEVVDLYQRVATHLSVVQSAGPDPQLIGRLSTLVARARGTVAGSRQSSWRERSSCPRLAARQKTVFFVGDEVTSLNFLRFLRDQSETLYVVSYFLNRLLTSLYSVIDAHDATEQIDDANLRQRHLPHFGGHALLRRIMRQ